MYFDNEIENAVIVKFNTEDYFLLSDLDPKALEKVIYSIKEVKPIKENKWLKKIDSSLLCKKIINLKHKK